MHIAIIPFSLLQSVSVVLGHHLVTLTTLQCEGGATTDFKL